MVQRRAMGTQMRREQRGRRSRKEGEGGGGRSGKGPSMILKRVCRMRDKDRRREWLTIRMSGMYGKSWFHENFIMEV